MGAGLPHGAGPDGGKRFGANVVLQETWLAEIRVKTGLDACFKFIFICFKAPAQ